MRDTDWEILDELGRNPNVSRAAAALFMSQPTLTKRLQRIEGELGVRVADRTPRGLVLTPEGSYLAQRASEHVRWVAETMRGLVRLVGAERGVVTIGSSYTFNKYNLWDVLAGYNRTHSEARFDVVNDGSDVLFRRLLDGDVDVAFVRGDYEGPVKRILVDRSQAYLVTKGPVDIAELPGMSRIEFSSNRASLRAIDAWWDERLDEPSAPGMTVGHLDFAWELVARGAGYVLCYVPENFSNEFGLTLTPLVMLDGTPVTRNSWCLWRAGERPAEALAGFVEYVREKVAIEPDMVYRPDES